MVQPAESVALESATTRQLEYAGKTLILVGTAHISSRSVEEVRRVIQEVRPDTVCVELDQTRYDTLLDDRRWRQLDIFQIIREKKVLFFLSSLALTAYQRKLGEQVGVRPGAELLAAVETAKEVDAELVLADRDIQATLKRSFHNLTFWNKLRLLQVLIESFFASGELTEEQIEQLKERDSIGEMMREFARVMPGLQVPLIDERDRFLMSSVREAPGRTVVGVVGAAHVEGMVRYLDEPVDRAALSVIPSPSAATQLLKWVIPAIVLAAFYWGYKQRAETSLVEMLYAWILPNSIAAALMAVLAGARPLTVVVSFIASPITSLNPTIGAGIVAGLVEAWLRKPTADDAARINEDMMSLRGMYGNRFTRVLLVALAVTIGSAVGAWIGATWVVKLL